MNPIRKISLGNWILIAMVLGLLVGMILNQYHDNPFIKEILMDNVFYFGGELFIRLMKMLVVPLVFCSIIMSWPQSQISASLEQSAEEQYYSTCSYQLLH